MIFFAFPDIMFAFWISCDFSDQGSVFRINDIRSIAKSRDTSKNNGMVTIKYSEKYKKIIKTEIQSRKIVF